MKWSRLEGLVGKENLEKIQNMTILIIGLGGVGGYAAESIARCGVQKMILVDPDTIDESNINRQIIATTKTIGRKKVDMWKERIQDIHPTCEVLKIEKFICEENLEELLKFNPDYIIDACDTLQTKKEIIRTCLKNHIKFISSMGTGNKLDPSKLKIMDIRKTAYDPLARSIRKMVKEEKLQGKIIVVCSDEKKIKTKNSMVASNSFVPATAGLLCTSYIINDIINLGDMNE